MAPVVRNRNGYIDKYIGDGLLALFHRPEDALVAAVEMQQALEQLNTGRPASAHLAMGIAVHYGVLRLGTVGEHDRMEDTVIADTVNTASRLEGLTKETGSRTLVTTDPELGRYFQGLNMQRLKGPQAKVFTYLMGATHQFDTSTLIATHRHLRIKPYHFDRAVACFHQCLLQGGVHADDAGLLKARFESYRPYILPADPT